MVRNQEALNEPQEVESRNKPLSPIQAAAKKAKEDAKKALEAAKPTTDVPTVQQVANPAAPDATNEASLLNFIKGGNKSTVPTTAPGSVDRMRENLEKMKKMQNQANMANNKAGAALDKLNSTMLNRIGSNPTVSNSLKLHEAASMGQAVESIKYSLQSVSADKINGCKSISQLNKLDAKLKTLRSRYNSYLNRYKRKAQAEEKKGNKVAVKLHNATIGDPKAFMLQYGDYIREINARIEMIRRRKKALAPDIGKPVTEAVFATVTDIDLQAIDYCISEATKLVESPDDEVFDVYVDESFNSVFAGKKLQTPTKKPEVAKTKTVSQPSYSSLAPDLAHRAVARTYEKLYEASFAAKHEIKQSDEYQRLMELKKTYKKTKDPKERVAMLEEAVDLAQKIKVYAHQNIPRDNPAEWIAHTFVEQFRHPLLILINLANAMSDSGNHYTLIQFTKYATRDSFVRRLDELESDLRTALRKAKKQAGMAKGGHSLFSESVDEAILDDEVLFEAADQFFLNEAKDPDNDKLKWVSEFKKGTGAVKDLYDMVQDHRDREAEKDRMKFGKDPKKSDPQDGPVYYQNNRQRGGINVAAAANAREIKGYSGHKTFDREVFTNMEMKKANEAIPTFAKATIGFIVDETEQVVNRDILVGCKVHVSKVKASDLISEVYNTIINKRKFLKFVKWITGDGVTLSDLMFATQEMKIDANASRNPTAARWLPAFRRRKRLNKIAIPYLQQNYLPNATVVMTQAEVNHIFEEYGLDITKSGHITAIMEENMLLGFAILDQSNETVKVWYDGMGAEPQQYTYAALERSDGQQTDRMLRELYRTVTR